MSGGGGPASAYGEPFSFNGVLGGGGNAMSGKRQMVPIANPTAQEKVEDAELIAALNRDFETLSSMTLIDNDANLDTLFLRQAAMKSKAYTFNLLINMYKAKYADLLDKYRGAQIWLSFCLITLVFGNENRLRLRCSNMSTSCIPVMHTSHEGFGLINRKRRRFTDASSDTSKRANTSRKPSHPFLQTAYYSAHSALFKIGTMTKYCVPTEFAIKFVRIKPGFVSKILSKSDKVTQQGLRGTFTRPILALVSTRGVQNFQFTGLAFMDNICQLVSEMSGLTAENEIVNLGIRQNMTVEDLIDNSTTSYSDTKNNDDGSSVIMAVIGSFQCAGTTAGTVDIRTYTDNVYRLITSRTAITDEEMDRHEQLNQDHEDEYASILDAYDDKLVELGFKQLNEDEETDVCAKTDKESDIANQ